MFWYVISAIALSIGALVATVFLLPMWVANAFEHRNNCNCNQCMVRRMAKWDRLNNQKEERKEVVPLQLGETELVSTRQLSTNDIVTSASTDNTQRRYTVREMVIREYGWVVILENRRTGATSWVRVANDRLDLALWRRHRPHRRGHVAGL